MVEKKEKETEKKNLVSFCSLQVEIPNIFFSLV